jgi:hypothetical protein
VALCRQWNARQPAFESRCSRPARCHFFPPKFLPRPAPRSFFLPRAPCAPAPLPWQQQMVSRPSTWTALAPARSSSTAPSWCRDRRLGPSRPTGTNARRRGCGSESQQQRLAAAAPHRHGAATVDSDRGAASRPANARRGCGSHMMLQTWTRTAPAAARSRRAWCTGRSRCRDCRLDAAATVDSDGPGDSWQPEQPRDRSDGSGPASSTVTVTDCRLGRPVQPPNMVPQHVTVWMLTPHYNAPGCSAILTFATKKLSTAHMDKRRRPKSPFVRAVLIELS